MKIKTLPAPKSVKAFIVENAILKTELDTLKTKMDPMKRAIEVMKENEVQLKRSRKTIKKMKLTINEYRKKIGSQRENLEELHGQIFCMEKEKRFRKKLLTQAIFDDCEYKG